MICTGFVVSIIKIISYINDGNENKQLHQDIKQMVYNDNIIENNVLEDNTSQDNLLDDEAQEQYTQYEKVYNNLLEINEDAIGWISISNTEIDYPVLQADDNDYYLSHNVNKEKSVRGSIFMDWQNRKNDSHIILYGHNMKDGSMLGNMKRYEEQEYYDGRAIIEFNMYGKLTRWEIFSVAFLDNKPLRVQFKDTIDFYEYINKMKEESIYNAGVDIIESDRVLTLSTCSNKFHNARLVLHTKLVE